MVETYEDDAVRAMVRRNRAEIRRRNKRKATLFVLAGASGMFPMVAHFGFAHAALALGLLWATGILIYLGIFAWRVRRWN